MFTGEPALEAAYKALDNLTPEEARRVLEEYRENKPAGFPDSEDNRYNLWRILLIGVMVIAVAGVVVGTILAVNKLDATAAWVLATAATTGVLALFSKSPTDATG